MTKPLCEDLRGRVIDAVEGGMSRRVAAERFGVSVKCWRETGLRGPRPRGGDKRSQRIEAYKDEILAAVEAKANMTLVEIAEFLRSDHGLRVGSLGIFAIFSDNTRGIYRADLLHLPVDIDIKPGSDPNSVNLSSAGVIPVAILSSDTFDATTVNPDTLTLGGAKVKLVGKSGRSLCHDEDSDGDGLLDFVCQFETAQFMIVEGVSVATLEGETINGVSIFGEDTVQIVPD
jgi:transposase